MYHCSTYTDLDCSHRTRIPLSGSDDPPLELPAEQAANDTPMKPGTKSDLLGALIRVCFDALQDLLGGSAQSLSGERRRSRGYPAALVRFQLDIYLVLQDPPTLNDKLHTSPLGEYEDVVVRRRREAVGTRDRVQGVIFRCALSRVVNDDKGEFMPSPQVPKLRDLLILVLKDRALALGYAPRWTGPPRKSGQGKPLTLKSRPGSSPRQDDGTKSALLLSARQSYRGRARTRDAETKFLGLSLFIGSCHV